MGVMTEPSVRHIEQRKTRRADDAIIGASTPMVERTFRLLDLLSAAEDGLTFSDLVRALGISKGSLHGLLKSLERTRAVEQVERYVVERAETDKKHSSAIQQREKRIVELDGSVNKLTAQLAFLPR